MMNRELAFSGLMALVFHVSAFIIAPSSFQEVQYRVKRGPSSMKVKFLQFQHAESKKTTERMKEEMIETKEVIQPEIEEIVQDLRAEVVEISVNKETVSVEVSPDEVLDQPLKETMNEETIMFQSEENDGAEMLAQPIDIVNKAPKYPRWAILRGYEGRMVLNVEVLPNGECGEIKVVQSTGYRILDKTAFDTIKKWIFIPAKRYDKSVRSLIEIPVQFSLEDRGS